MGSNVADVYRQVGVYTGRIVAGAPTSYWSPARVVYGQHIWEKIITCRFRPCEIIFDPNNQRRRVVGCAAWLRWSR